MSTQAKPTSRANKMLGSSSLKITPLWVVASFVTLTETALAYALTKVEGGVQIALTAFVICFALLVAGAFFAILWNRPYVFYAPSEFAGTDPKNFIEAMRSSMPQRVVDQIKKVEDIEAKPDDSEPQFALIDSLIDEPIRQHIILMHESIVDLPYVNYWGAESRYETGNSSGSWSCGSLSGIELARKLDGTGLVEIKPKGPAVSLTRFGHEFGQWLIDSDRKADFLKSPFGGWGTPTRPQGAPENFFDENFGIPVPPTQKTKSEPSSKETSSNQ